ncbi:serine/threonine-protein kinase [Paractinoplanes rhizophilus]|uniref:non-specific serine/threonine protein kinase n=1 Tax=Paractinoplanes rhizophilus TaxID=1416877 RepID=A0ABW2HH31_9ACTN
MQSSLSMSGRGPGDVSGAGPAEAATADLSGRCVGNSYVLVCPVGHGATGTVWRGIDRSTGEYVAVKLLHEGLLRQPKLVIRFVQERTILMMMRHENIVGVHDLFSVGGSLALVMDYVSGGSLRNRLISAGTLPPAEAATLLAQVAAALAQAHELGVVHRDVKPDNILLQESGGRHEVRLTDFGIARVLDAAGLTTPQAIVGTPHYMAPEAIQGDAEPASDVYSAGIVLYELVTGAPPYSGEPLAVLRRHVDDSPERPPGMPHPVWSLIAWCLDKDPARRPTAGELGGALRDLARQMTGVPALTSTTQNPDLAYGSTAHLGQPHPSARRRPARKRPRNGPRSWLWRRPGMMVALVAAAVAISGLGGFNAWQLIGAGDPPGATGDATRPGAGGPGPGGTAAGTGASTGVPGAAGQLSSKVPEAASAGISSGGPETPEQARQRAEQAREAANGGRAQAGAAASAGPARAGGKVQFGPWRCGDSYSWDLGHPVLARPCYAIGPSVRVLGEMEAAPGVQIDLAMTIRDVRTDQVAAGPYECKGLLFTDFAFKHNCGPAEFDPPRGHRYVVVETWRYTQRPLLPSGSARGPEFDW